MRPRRRDDYQRVNVLNRRELAYWCSRFGATVEELRAAVCKVGPIVQRVEEELSKKP
jgi:Protein of unknown function (DUF3606)